MTNQMALKKLNCKVFFMMKIGSELQISCSNNSSIVSELLKSMFSVDSVIFIETGKRQPDEQIKRKYIKRNEYSRKNN